MEKFNLQKKINCCLRLYGISAALWPIVLGLLFFVKYLFQPKLESGLYDGFAGGGEWFFACIMSFFIVIPYFIILTFLFSFLRACAKIITSTIKSLFLSLYTLFTAVLITVICNFLIIKDDYLFVAYLIVLPIALYAYFLISNQIDKKRKIAIY
ncbi:MAG: hypothetical protein J6Y87_02435 [Muribaculaceae bacterium]|nr:hypothetical protein [Muribaculaceae bacterium]